MSRIGDAFKAKMFDGNAFTVKTPQMDYIFGYTEFQTPSVNKAEVVIDKNNPGDLWDF
jgi:hypothetical protein